VSPEGESESQTTNPPDSRSIIFWRCVFLAAETYVISAISLLAIPEFFGMYYRSESQLLNFALAFFFITAWLFLFIVSPFFLRSLRSIALAGWIIAFGVIILGILMPVQK
jgi:hypothetical protein